MFEGTVRDNLTMWDATVRIRDVTRACKDAAIAEVVASAKAGSGYVAEGGTILWRAAATPGNRPRPGQRSIIPDP